MKVHMPDLKIVSTVRRHGLPIRQNAVLVREDFQSARIFRLIWRGSVSARGQNDRPIGGLHAHLVTINSNIESHRGLHLCTQRAVGSNGMNGYAARIVVSDEDMGARTIGSGMDRSRR